MNTQQGGEGIPRGQYEQAWRCPGWGTGVLEENQVLQCMWEMEGGEGALVGRGLILAVKGPWAILRGLA